MSDPQALRAAKAHSYRFFGETSGTRRAPALFALAWLLGAAILAISGTAAFAQKKPSRAPAPGVKKSAPRKKPLPSSAPSTAEKQLTELARALHDQPTPEAYARLSAFAAQHAKAALGGRAALALGYYKFTQADYAGARHWLDQAAADPLLADYALYWQALTDRAMGENDAALAELKRYRQIYPASVMNDSAVEELARAALAVNRADEAATALETYSRTGTKASLVLLRGQAHEVASADRGEKPVAAAKDYLDVVYRFPLSEEAKTAGAKIPDLRTSLGEQFPGTPLTTEIARAEAFYDARRWADLRSAYQALLPKLSGTDHDRGVLRLAQAGVQSGHSLEPLASLALADPGLDAERLYALSQAQRSAKNEPDMFATIEQTVQRYPQSPWAEEALYAAGNDHWNNLERDAAVEWYRRLLAAFPAGRYASMANWRIAWTAYLERKPDAADRIEQFVRQYPASPFAVDALYWLGRAKDRAGDASQAQGYYAAAAKRFPQTYFGERAAERLQHANGDPDPPPVASLIPPVPPLQSLDGPWPPAADAPWTRAQALASIAFDNSAELELRAAYAATHAPEVLFAAAKAAVAAGHYAAGITAVRQIAPQLESRRLGDLPDEVWRTAFPLPYRDALEREALRNRLDPMLVAGLIRQESAFASDAVSRSDALGLMQLLPPTGAQMARVVRLQFSRAQLFDPEYNVRLGTLYFSNLLASLSTPEAALAAYNAGPDRVAAWTRGQNYEETPEFVESIPLSETRDYVQIVLRNADLYRRIYGAAGAPKPAVAQAR